MKLTPKSPKLLWMHLDLDKLYQANMPWDMYDAMMGPMFMIGYVKPKTYPYMKDHDDE